MSVARLVDPMFVPNDEHTAFLAELTYQELIRKQPFTKEQTTKRKAISKIIGETASFRLLATLGPDWIVVDANTIRQNMKGHDLTVARRGAGDRKLRVQSKCCTYLESVQFRMKHDHNAAAWGFDVLLLVDAGITLDRLGQFPEITTKPQSHVNFYVFTRNEVMTQLAHARRREDKVDDYIYRCWAPQGPHTKEAIHQIPDIDLYRGRFDVIEKMLTTL